MAFHAFVSHCWASGQDSARVIKQLLMEVLPGIRVFLDVDDLKDVSKIEEYVDQTRTIIVFCSRGYFRSINCLRELCRGTENEHETRHASEDSERYHTFFVSEADRDKGAITYEEALDELTARKAQGEELYREHFEASGAAKACAKMRELKWPLPYTDAPEDTARWERLLRKLDELRGSLAFVANLVAANLARAP